MPLASFAASAAEVATPSFGTGMAYASQTSLPSGAVSEVRPSAFTVSRMRRTAVLSCAIVVSFIDRSGDVRRRGLKPDSDRARRAQLFDLLLAVPQLREHLLRVLAQQRRARHLGRAVRHLDRIADRQILAALRVIDLDDGSGLAQRRLLGDLFHRQNWTAGNVVLVEHVHRLELVLGLGPLLDLPEDLHQMRQARLGRRVARIGQPLLLADHLADVLPDRRLRDEVDVGVRIRLPAFALEDPPGLSATGCVAGARY